MIEQASSPIIDRDIQSRLEKRLPELRLENVALDRVVDFLRDMSGANIVVNWRALREAGFTSDMGVTVERIFDVPLPKALDAVLASVSGSMRLVHVVQDNVIHITAWHDVGRHAFTYAHDIREIIVDCWSEPPPEQQLEKLVVTIAETIWPETWRELSGTIGSMHESGGFLIVTQISPV
ncbi:MAG TPA: hypothetical protein VF669_13230, partial [Tepidisphaeraceae bacterium]